MGKIICLMGKSSTGKDTIFRELMRNRELNLKRIVSYTTRPVRAGEVQGKQYFFVEEEEFQRLKEAGRVVEDRVYHTCHGLWRYFTVDDGRINLEKDDYIVIGTLESFVKSREYFGENKLIPVLIELDDGERLQRALDRERSQDHPKYEEMCRRFLADSADFSEENMKRAGISKRFYNGELETCISGIVSYIKEQLGREKTV